MKSCQLTLLIAIFSFFVPFQTMLAQPVAQTPPMGWNSYDCFGAAVTEAEVRANAEYMAKHLKSHGWEYVVVDYCWYYPHPPLSIQQNPPQFRLPQDHAPVPWMPMDEYGRLLPDPGKFPSAAHGNGFKELGDYIHSLGLKFGIHVMRGIPRQAVWAKSPILGAPGTDASMIADTSSICPWLNLMYGVDMDKSGAQAYYNSLFEMYAEWGVDFVKIDDMNMNREVTYHKDETEGYRKALENCGRPMVMSLSPNMHFEDREHMSEHADMWRISADFWDRWDRLEAQFERCAQWAYISGPQSWPDADMLPVGNLRLRGPFGEPGMSQFTKAEHYTLFTLWSIFRSPLMLGGNLPDTDPFLSDILTNDELIAVNQESINGKELFNHNDQVVWLADIPGSGDHYLALFNTSEESQTISFRFKNFSLSPSWNVRDILEKEDLGRVRGELTQTIEPHGAKLFSIRK